MSYPWGHIREEWEDPNQTIADNTNSGEFPWSTADLIAIHYTAAVDVPDGDPDELPWEQHVAAYLRAIQNDYVTGTDENGNVRRGYSIGYGCLVTQNGDDWEIRGVDWRNAANRNYNKRTFTILVFVDGADELTLAAVAKVRSLVAWFRQASPLASVQIVGHQEIGATACPGVGVQAQIVSGLLEPVAVPTPTPPPEEAPMLRLFKFDSNPPLFASADGFTAFWVSGNQWGKWLQLGLADPDDIETLARDEAIRYTLIGTVPPDYSGIWANSGQL